MFRKVKFIFNIVTLIMIFIYIISALIIPITKGNLDETVLAMNEVYYFYGEGTEQSPYLINSVSDLIYLGELVNSGNEFRNQYFLQTDDLDFKSIEQFDPIGKYHSDHYFYGIYDGSGYCLKNLYIRGTEKEGNVALFGQLAGTVKNLGIESGLIQGTCIGSIASHSVGNEAKIINCYNKATLKASGRAGGIADNFSRGQIINCWNEGAMEAPETGGISSYNASMIYNSYCVQENMVNPYFKGTITLLSGYYNQSMDEIPQKMDMGIPVAIQEFGLKEDSLLFWDMEGESISFKKKEE